jgi:anion-transporting  ArsA/GET3 family ATPase
VYQLLRSPATAFVLVATPEEQVLGEAEYFCRKVRELGMSLRAVVFNRAHREMAGGRRDVERREVAALMTRLLGDATVAATLADNFVRYEALGRGDGLRMEAFRRALPKDVVKVEVPNFNSDVHSVAGLRAMHPFLFAA